MEGDPDRSGSIGQSYQMRKNQVPYKPPTLAELSLWMGIIQHIYKRIYSFALSLFFSSYSFLIKVPIKGESFSHSFSFSGTFVTSVA